MTKFKTFKKLNTAAKAANGRPIVRVGNLYLVADGGDMISLGLAEVALLTPTGRGSHATEGHVTLRHLARLGNANWAEAKKTYAGNGINWEG